MDRNAKLNEKDLFTQKIWLSGHGCSLYDAQKEAMEAVAIHINKIRQKDGVLNSHFIHDDLEASAFLLNPNLSEYRHVTEVDVPHNLSAHRSIKTDVKIGRYKYTEDNHVTLQKEYHRSSFMDVVQGEDFNSSSSVW